jgi:hypothetical protein
VLGVPHHCLVTHDSGSLRGQGSTSPCLYNRWLGYVRFGFVRLPVSHARFVHDLPTACIAQPGVECAHMVIPDCVCCCCYCCLHQAQAFAVSGVDNSIEAYALAVADAINTGGDQATTAYAQAFASASAGWYMLMHQRLCSVSGH